LVFASQDPDNFSAAVSGSDVEQLRTCWQASGGPSAFRWFVYSAPSDRIYALPTLPAGFGSLFGEVAIQDFELLYAELMDYPQLVSFDDVIMETFRSAEPFSDTIHTARLTGFWPTGAEPTEPVVHHNSTRDTFGGQR
jgi:hypothetical protein